MGSEGPTSPITIHVTGFKKFHGVAENPTETIVNNLQGYLDKRVVPNGLIIGSCTILETAGQGAVVSLYQTLQSSVSKDNTVSSSSRVIWPIQPTSILQNPIPSPLSKDNTILKLGPQAGTIIQQAEPGFNPMKGIPKGHMYMMCDKVQTTSASGSAPFLTRFNVRKTERAWDFAKLALDSYNQRKQKNFTLENVCKINKMTFFYCMILRASDAETDECRLFRCVVNGSSDYVMLCEIMDVDTISGDGDYFAAVASASRSKDAYTRNRAKRGRI